MKSKGNSIGWWRSHVDGSYRIKTRWGYRFVTPPKLSNDEMIAHMQAMFVKCSV